jgi:hypothetical protein
VGLDVFDVDGTGFSTSNQALEVLAGHHQLALQAVHQLQKMNTVKIELTESLEKHGFFSKN